MWLRQTYYLSNILVHSEDGTLCVVEKRNIVYQSAPMYQVPNTRFTYKPFETVNLCSSAECIKAMTWCRLVKESLA